MYYVGALSIQLTGWIAGDNLIGLYTIGIYYLFAIFKGIITIVHVSL